MGDMAYVAFHSCGRICAVTIERPETRPHVARDVASWIRRGERVERMSVAEAKATNWCQCAEEADCAG